MAKIHNSDNIKCWQGSGTGTFTHCWWKCNREFSGFLQNETYCCSSTSPCQAQHSLFYFFLALILSFTFTYFLSL